MERLALVDVPGAGDELAWVPGGGAPDSLALGTGPKSLGCQPGRSPLEDPSGVTGTIASDGPIWLHEARRAVQAGKLSRKMGLTLVRHDQQCEQILHAETRAVGACKMPDLPEDVTNARTNWECRRPWCAIWLRRWTSCTLGSWR